MTKFADGLRAFKPNENAPSFIKANIAVNKQELLTWLKDQPDTVRLVLKESKEGKYYIQVDEYVREDVTGRE